MESIKDTISTLYNMTGRWIAITSVIIFILMTTSFIMGIRRHSQHLRWFWNIREYMVICSCLLIVIATFCDDPNMGITTWASDKVSVNFIPETPNGTVNLDIPINDENGDDLFTITDTVKYSNLTPGTKYTITGQLINTEDNAATVQEEIETSDTEQNKIYDTEDETSSQTRLRVDTPTEAYKTTLRITFLCGMGIILCLLLETIALAIRKRHAILMYTKKEKKIRFFSQYNTYCIIYISFLLACISKLAGSIVATSIFIIYVSIKRTLKAQSGQVHTVVNTET